MKITIKVLGGKFSIETADDANYKQAIDAFQELTGKALAGMDLFTDGKKVTNLDSTIEGNEIVAIKSKHESA